MQMPSALKIVDRSEQRIYWLRVGWALFGLLLFGVTWRLWTGQTEFPQIPLLNVGQLIPRGLDRVTFVVIMLSLMVSLLISMFGRQLRLAEWVERLPVAAFCVPVVLTVVANQHRLQPWAYLAWLTAVVLVFCRTGKAVRLLRILVISVYVHSAISKLDHEFLTTLGPTFVSTIRDWMGVEGRGNSDAIAAAVFPLTELLVGVGLCFQRSCRLAVAGALIMHLTLICLLSPFGLRHEPAVLIWNAYFIWQIVVLFGRPNGEQGVSQPRDAHQQYLMSATRTLGEECASVLIGSAVLLPLLEPVGWFDHWPAWGLYAPRNGRCTLYFDDEAIDELPGWWNWELVDTLDEELGWSPGLEVPLSRESLRRLHVPIYPQDRFQLGVALALARQAGVGDAVKVVWEGASARMTGERERETFTGTREIEAAAKRFWLNVEPR